MIDVSVTEDSLDRLRCFTQHNVFPSYVRELRIWTDILDRFEKVKDMGRVRDLFFHIEKHTNRDRYLDTLENGREIQKRSIYLWARHNNDWKATREQQLNLVLSGAIEEVVKNILRRCSNLKVLLVKTHQSHRSCGYDVWEHCDEESFRVAGPLMLQTSLFNLHTSASLKKAAIDCISWHSLQKDLNVKDATMLRAKLESVTDLELFGNAIPESSPLQYFSNRIHSGTKLLLEAMPQITRLRLNLQTLPVIGHLSLRTLVGDATFSCLESLYLNGISLDYAHLVAFIGRHKFTLQEIVIRGARLQAYCRWRELLQDTRNVHMLKRFEFIGSQCPEAESGFVEHMLCPNHWIVVKYNETGEKSTRFVHIGRVLKWLVCGSKSDENGLSDGLSCLPPAFWNAISWDLVREYQFEALTNRALWHDAEHRWKD